MNNYFEQALPYLELLGVISLPTFLVSLIIIPWIIGKLPHNYFLHSKEKGRWSLRKHPILMVCIFLLRNIFGLLFLLAGFIMLFLPGQGILTMVVGISLMTFPGKQALLQKMIHHQSIQRSLNWVRKKTGKKPFLWDK